MAVGSCVITATAAGTANYNEATATYTVTVLDNDTPPSAPTLTTLDRNEQVKLMWQAPGSDGGSPILRYQYRQKVGALAYGNWMDILNSAPGEANATSYTVMELTNSVQYRFRGAGGERRWRRRGIERGDRAYRRPITTPGKLRAPQISSGNGSVIVQWLPPEWDGGTEILHYEYCLRPIHLCDEPVGGKSPTAHRVAPITGSTQSDVQQRQPTQSGLSAGGKHTGRRPPGQPGGGAAHRRPRGADEPDGRSDIRGTREDFVERTDSARRGDHHGLRPRALARRRDLGP